MQNELMDVLREAAQGWHDDQLAHSQMLEFALTGEPSDPAVMFTELLDALKELYAALEEPQLPVDMETYRNDVVCLEALVAGMWNWVLGD